MMTAPELLLLLLNAQYTKPSFKSFLLRKRMRARRTDTLTPPGCELLLLAFSNSQGSLGILDPEN